MQKIPSVTSNRLEQEEEEEDCYKPEKLGKFYSDYFIIYESRGNKKTSIEVDHTYKYSQK